ncbi:MAG TPA: hypothetical protein DHW63_01335 [Hyphomonadaceae bacterium]|nr:hypothetical protein [Hyphomonadaceae bacterium]
MGSAPSEASAATIPTFDAAQDANTLASTPATLAPSLLCRWLRNASAALALIGLTTRANSAAADYRSAA